MVRCALDCREHWQDPIQPEEAEIRYKTAPFFRIVHPDARPARRLELMVVEAQIRLVSALGKGELRSWPALNVTSPSFLPLKWPASSSGMARHREYITSAGMCNGPSHLLRWLTYRICLCLTSLERQPCQTIAIPSWYSSFPDVLKASTAHGTPFSYVDSHLPAIAFQAKVGTSSLLLRSRM